MLSVEAQGLQRLPGGLRLGGDGHDEAVQEEIAVREADFSGGLQDGGESGETFRRRLGNAVGGKGQAEDGGAVFFRQREEAGNTLRLGADGIDEGAAGVDPQPRF